MRNYTSENPSNPEYDAYLPLVHRVDRTVFFYDDISSESICRATVMIKKMLTESIKKPIEIVLSTEGGECYTGLAFYDFLRTCPCQVTIIGTGIIASMGLIIFLAGDHRVVTEHTRIMSHQVSTDISGKLTDMEIDLKETKTIDDIMLKIVAERTNQSVSKLKKEVKTGDKWMSAEQAKLEGYVHKIVKNKKNKKSIRR